MLFAYCTVYVVVVIGNRLIKKMVDVTVLVATYNEDKYIGRCLRSIIKQS